MAKFCTKCSRELTAGNKFCPGCGAPVPADTVNQGTVPTQGGMPAYSEMQESAGGEIPDSEIVDLFEGIGSFVDYKVEIDIIGEQKIPKADIEYVLSEEYDVDEIYAKSASAAYVLDIAMSISMGDYSDSETDQIPVAKINGLR